MVIEPSNYVWKHFKDVAHFYTLLGLIPCSVISAIVGMRANPELREIPEGYEPRHWEYYRHPITRFIAKYLFTPPDIDDECFISLFEQTSETKIMQQIARDVDKVMAFYNDHRSRYFTPYYAETHRQGRDYLSYAYNFLITREGHHIDAAYQPSTPVPVEGYKPGSLDGPPEE